MQKLTNRQFILIDSVRRSAPEVCGELTEAEIGDIIGLVRTEKSAISRIMAWRETNPPVAQVVEKRQYLVTVENPKGGRSEFPVMATDSDAAAEKVITSWARTPDVSQGMRIVVIKSTDCVRTEVAPKPAAGCHEVMDYMVTLTNGNVVHFDTAQSATASLSKYPGSRYASVVKNVPCYRPTRGYCSLCHSYQLNAGEPDYTAGTAMTPANERHFGNRAKRFFPTKGLGIPNGLATVWDKHAGDFVRDRGMIVQRSWYETQLLAAALNRGSSFPDACSYASRFADVPSSSTSPPDRVNMARLGLTAAPYGKSPQCQTDLREREPHEQTAARYHGRTRQRVPLHDRDQR